MSYLNIASRLHRGNYRSDIDGIRAIAVLLVVLGHAFPNKLPGGFIGVDIFFVISGYLITNIIVSNMDEKKVFSKGILQAAYSTNISRPDFVVVCNHINGLGLSISAGI